MTVRPLSWACGHGTEILLILKKLFLTWLLPDIFQYDSPKKCPTITTEFCKKWISGLKLGTTLEPFGTSTTNKFDLSPGLHVFVPNNFDFIGYWNGLTLPARRPTVVVRIWRLQTSDSDDQSRSTHCKSKSISNDHRPIT